MEVFQIQFLLVAEIADSLQTFGTECEIPRLVAADMEIRGLPENRRDFGKIGFQELARFRKGRTENMGMS